MDNLSQKNAVRSSRSLGIDALRGIAVLSVMFCHSFVPKIGVYLYDAFLSFFIRYGALGVDLFFVLSGFCIHSAYSKADEAFRAKNYLARRWLRIYPPYFFALGLAVIFNFITNYSKWRTGGIVTWDNFGPIQILSHLFLVHDFSQKTMQTISGPFWTIAMEAQYYLLYLVFKPFFYSKKGWVFLFSVALALYLIAWQLYYLPIAIQPLRPFCYWIEWILGAFLVYLTKNESSVFNCQSGYFLFLLVALLLSAYASNIFVDPNVNRLIIAGAFFFLIALFLKVEEFWKIPVFRWLPSIGLFSYSIYLTHFLFMDRIRTFVIPRLAEGWPRFFVSVATIFACLCGAYLFFVFFEKPYMKKSAAIPKH